MDIPNMAAAAKIKGLQLVGTGDVTHPKYFEEIKKETKEYFILRIDQPYGWTMPWQKENTVTRTLILQDLCLPINMI